ncbi:hypothetical protein GPJ56_007903 [Histomonas meleagridis]|uniref:uncharacterized protein n=1 Tax=Histomonas meleagridis TaxID=135588 RepID=UPI00355AB639|nr:hypothetical protein GPJ56_007903 [Histomonas meleagridis]KAH0803845.1 hypothetical protein GO595_002675 [Histomonas meleagridis]
MLQGRPLVAWESYFVGAKVYLQMALKCKDASLVEPTLQKMSKCVLGLHSKIVGNNKMLTQKQEVPVCAIPDNLNLVDACQYMYDNHTRPMDQTLATLGANKDTIVLNASHIVADGAYLLYLFNALRYDSKLNIPNEITPVDIAFRDQIQSSTVRSKFNITDPDLARYNSKDPTFLNLCDVSHQNVLQSSIKDFKCYSNGKVHGLTDSLWANILLTIAAINGDFDHRAISTTINLRPYREFVDFGIACAFSSLTVTADADKNTTVGEFMKRLRSNFTTQINAGNHFGYLKGIENGISNDGIDELTGAALELSHVGRFQVGGPFSDVSIGCTTKHQSIYGLYSFVSYSVEDENGRNDLVSKIRHDPCQVTDEDAFLYGRTIHHALKTIDPKIKCGDAIEILKEYYKKLRKETRSKLIKQGFLYVIIHNLQSNEIKMLKKIQAHTNGLSTVEYVPKWKGIETIVTGSLDKSARFWRVQDLLAEGSDVSSYDIFRAQDNICRIALLGEHQLAYQSWDKQTYIISERDDKITLNHGDLASWDIIKFSDFFITAEANHSIKVWSNTGKFLHEQKEAHLEAVRGLFTYRVNIYSFGNDGVLKEWELHSRSYLQETRSLQVTDSYLYCCDIINNHCYLGSESGFIYDIDLHEFCIKDSYATNTSIWSICHFNMTDIYTAESTGVIHCFTKDTNKLANPEQEQSYFITLKSHEQHNQTLERMTPSDFPTTLEDNPEPGQVYHIMENGKLQFYFYSFSYEKWICIGYLNFREKKPKILDQEGNLWDTSFTIMINDNTSLRCYLNYDSDPDEIANNFIQKHKLPNFFLPQIKEFIKINIMSQMPKTTTKLKQGEFKGENWFIHYFGFEETLTNVYKNIQIIPKENYNEIISLTNRRHFSAGTFNLYSPKDFQNLPIRGNGRFFIIKGKGGKSIEDVLRQQNDPNYNGATFQCASNFNCLEFPSINSCASDGISSYAIDLTQGPTLAIASPAGILYRNYFIEHDNVKGQIKSEINLLQKTPIKVIHGKAVIKSNDIDSFNRYNWEDENNYLVGVHENLDVNTNRGDGKWVYKESVKDQMVHQIFCAAFNFRMCPKTEQTLNWTYHMLRSEYRTTILAAWNNSLKYPGRTGSNKCVLTLVGGGVFDNPMEVVCKAIEANEDVIAKSGLEVYLVCFDDRASTKVCPLLNGLVERTNGGIFDA